MQGDIFTSTQKNLNNKSQIEENENNFFLQLDNAGTKNISPSTKRRLNDYDFNLLKEDAYKDVQDDSFKLEYQISKLEASIVNIDKQIKAAKEIRDFELAELLFSKQKSMQEDLASFTKLYNELSLSAKISGNFTSTIKSKINDIKKNWLLSTTNILSRLSGKISSIMELRSSLDKLENINKSVDELMSMQIPYGEANYRYDILSKYISKANSIQTEIAKIVK